VSPDGKSQTFAEPTIAAIQAAVCGEFALPMRDLLGERRSRHLARPRQIGMWLAVRLTSRSLSVIARQFGRDRSTLYTAIEAIDHCIFECDAWGRAALALQRRLGADERQTDLVGV
jgi:chromosomal replication initiation ATPase DnaA